MRLAWSGGPGAALLSSLPGTRGKGVASLPPDHEKMRTQIHFLKTPFGLMWGGVAWGLGVLTPTYSEEREGCRPPTSPLLGLGSSWRFGLGVFVLSFSFSWKSSSMLIETGRSVIYVFN